MSHFYNKLANFDNVLIILSVNSHVSFEGLTVCALDAFTC